MAGRTVGYAGAVIVVALGCIFIVGGALLLCSASAPGVDFGSRLMLAAVSLLVGIILMGIGVAIFWVIRTRGPAPIQQITQQLELDMPGDTTLETLKCRNCGAQLDKDSVSLAAGAVVINCPYCGTTYQIAEEPKW